MHELNKNELLDTTGGGVSEILNGTIISTLVKGASLFYDIGRSFGSSIRRIFSGNICKL